MNNLVPFIFFAPKCNFLTCFCIFFKIQILFGKEADKLEHANDDERTYYIIEKDPLVNTFISVPKDKGWCLFIISYAIIATISIILFH